MCTIDVSFNLFRYGSTISRKKMKKIISRYLVTYFRSQFTIFPNNSSKRTLSLATFASKNFVSLGAKLSRIGHYKNQSN